MIVSEFLTLCNYWHNFTFQKRLFYDLENYLILIKFFVCAYIAIYVGKIWKSMIKTFSIISTSL